MRPSSRRSRRSSSLVGRETPQRCGRRPSLLRADETQPGVRELIQATLDLVRGLGLANTLGDDTSRRRRILDQSAATLDLTLHGGKSK